MNDARELDLLQSAWRENAETIPAGLRQLVHRQTWLMRLGAAAEVLVAMAFLAGSIWLARTQPEPQFRVLAIAIWIITLAAAICSFQNRAGTWRPSSLDTRACLELLLRRCSASLRGITFGFYLLLVEVLLLAGWHTWYWSSHSPAPGIAFWLSASSVPAVFLIVLLILRRRKQRELNRLEALRRDLN